jgi:hypothetical protein
MENYKSLVLLTKEKGEHHASSRESAVGGEEVVG